MTQIKEAEYTIKNETLQEEIFSGSHYLSLLISEINHANIAIDLETYIYGHDDFGKKIADALIDAKKRNVKVRVIVDGVGTPFFHEHLLAMEKAGIPIRVFHPIPFLWTQFRRTSYPAIFLHKLFYFFANLNSRNHRKFCIIDHHIIIVGSANVDQRHLSIAKGGQGWRDIILKISNVNVEPVEYAFNISWEGSPFKKLIQKHVQSKPINDFLRLNYTRKLRRHLAKQMLRQFTLAKIRIWITCSYFNPDYRILKKLSNAAQRGVDVRIILPEKTDVAIMKIVAATFYQRLLKAKVKIYEYLPSILHAKAMIVDDWYIVGSSNLNQRSMRHDLEIDVSLQTPAAKLQLIDHFLENFRDSRLLTPADIRKIPWYKKLSGYFLMFIRTLL